MKSKTPLISVIVPHLNQPRVRTQRSAAPKRMAPYDNEAESQRGGLTNRRVTLSRTYPASYHARGSLLLITDSSLTFHSISARNRPTKIRDQPLKGAIVRIWQDSSILLVARWMAEARKKILCIEDDQETAALIATELIDRGFDVIVAYDGHEGFVAILKTMPD